MISEKQTKRKFKLYSSPNKISHKPNVAKAKTARLKADNEAAVPNFGLWDLDKKKEQFLTIDRF